MPALALALAVVSFAGQIAGSYVSRAVEARADAFALRLTDDPDAFIALERRLALQNVSDPDPPRLLHALFGTHPTTEERLGYGEAYRSAGPSARSSSGNSGRFLIPSVVCHFEKLSSMASISSRMKRGDTLTRETTTPGTSSSSISWSTRAKVIVNS